MCIRDRLSVEHEWTNLLDKFLFGSLEARDRWRWRGWLASCQLGQIGSREGYVVRRVMRCTLDTRRCAGRPVLRSRSEDTEGGYWWLMRWEWVRQVWPMRSLVRIISFLREGWLEDGHGKGCGFNWASVLVGWWFFQVARLCGCGDLWRGRGRDWRRVWWQLFLGR